MWASSGAPMRRCECRHKTAWRLPRGAEGLKVSVPGRARRRAAAPICTCNQLPAQPQTNLASPRRPHLVAAAADGVDKHQRPRRQLPPLPRAAPCHVRLAAAAAGAGLGAGGAEAGQVAARRLLQLQQRGHRGAAGLCSGEQHPSILSILDDSRLGVPRPRRAPVQRGEQLRLGRRAQVGVGLRAGGEWGSAATCEGAPEWAG